MKIERISHESFTVRVLDTTCPKCKQHVQFALNNDEHVHDEIEHLEKIVDGKQVEIERLRTHIDFIIAATKKE